MYVKRLSRGRRLLCLDEVLAGWKRAWAAPMIPAMDTPKSITVAGFTSSAAWLKFTRTTVAILCEAGSGKGCCRIDGGALNFFDRRS
jgi:hypothetical protein